MIFRIKNNKLFEVVLNSIISENKFLEKQKNGTTKFIQIDYKDLPKEKITFKPFYKLEDEKIVIDEERTSKYNIEMLKKSIEKRADDLVKNQLKELDYNDMGEVALYTTNENSKWHGEAVALRQWIEDIYKKMYELIDTVTVDNYKDINLDEIKTEFLKIKFINPNINANLNTNINNITSPSLTK